MTNSMTNNVESTITVNDDAVILNHTRWLLYGQNIGEKKIFYSSISSVEFKKPFFLSYGYIQFNIPGHIAAESFDEYTFYFQNSQIETAQELYELILSNIEKAKNKNANSIIQQTFSPIDEIKKLKELLDMGAISQSEFEEKKEKLMQQI